MIKKYIKLRGLGSPVNKQSAECFNFIWRNETLVSVWYEGYILEN